MSVSAEKLSNESCRRDALILQHKGRMDDNCPQDEKVMWDIVLVIDDLS
jgi:hypothetical protein